MNKVLGIERINERTKRPNALINFIKPLETPDRALAQDFLERVAAVCYPIMKANHIAVMSLEEYPPNLEFVGRNFNAGEVIQLVLKAPHTNQWLPFKHVQMVMMHELAHCKQMNHSRAFWKVRNDYADELKGLWAKDYTGEGLWGRGQSLISGQYMTNHMPEAANAPRSLCGGTYRSSGGRKRKRKEDRPKVSYAERQQRRIAKKFGTNGVALGDDEGVRTKLESGQKGKKPMGKPRVAGSNRGRELRAAAALARFETVKKEAVKVEPKSEPVSDDEYETDSDYENAGGIFNPEDGNMVKVCENEDAEDKDARRELDELREIDNEPVKPQSTRSSGPSKRNQVFLDDASTDSDDDQDLKKQHSDTHSRQKKKEAEISNLADDASTAIEDEIQEITTMPTAVRSTAKSNESSKNRTGFNTSIPSPASDDASTASENEDINLETNTDTIKTAPVQASTVPGPVPTSEHSSSAIIPNGNTDTACPICSLENEPESPLCAACSHVLIPALMPKAWKCQTENCRQMGYINPTDYGVCGLCGVSKS